MSIKLSDPFIPIGGVWYRFRGFIDHLIGWGGVDYSFYSNSEILAVFPGKIILQRYEADGFGHRIDLRSSDDPRYVAVYAHNTSKIVVKTGTDVIRGQLIKYSDNSGRSTGPHLHLTVLFNGRAVDPEKLPWKVYNWKEPQKPKEVDEMLKTAADVTALWQAVFYAWPNAAQKKAYIGKDILPLLKGWVAGSSGSYKLRREIYLKKYPATVKELASLKATLESDYVTKEVLAQSQDKYEKMFHEQEILYKGLAGKWAEEHKLLTKLEAKFDTIQTDREEINELLDIAPEAIKPYL